MKKNTRKHRRYPCLGVVEIKADQGDTVALIITAMMYNISPSGMKCSSMKHLPEGTPIRLHIHEFMGAKVLSEIKGTVTWSSKAGSMYYMGIRFIEELNNDRYPELCELICADNAAA
jgi:hypothetical protein